jgi:hypothetical protein
MSLLRNPVSPFMKRRLCAWKLLKPIPENSTKLYQPENQNQLGFAWWCIWWRDKLLFLLIHSCKWQPIRSIHYLWTLVSFIASFYVLIVTISFSGKCFGNRGQIHETHKVLFQSISVLVSRNPFGHTCPSVPLTSLLDYIGKEIVGDAFTVERAEILYNICWFSLKNYHSKDTRYLCNCRYLCVWYAFYSYVYKFNLCFQHPLFHTKNFKQWTMVWRYRYGRF